MVKSCFKTKLGLYYKAKFELSQCFQQTRMQYGDDIHSMA